MDHNTAEEADLFLGIRPHWGPGIMRGSPLADASGWIQADPETLQISDDRIWAVGDAAGLRTPDTGTFTAKTGLLARIEAEVAARNIAMIIEGASPRFRYQGKGGLLVWDSLSRARYFLIRHYAHPRPFTWLSPPSRALHWAKMAMERYWLARWL